MLPPSLGPLLLYLVKTGPEARLCHGLFPAAGTRTPHRESTTWDVRSALRPGRLHGREGFGLMFSETEERRFGSQHTGQFRSCLPSQGEASGDCQGRNCWLTLDRDRCLKRGGRSSSVLANRARPDHFIYAALLSPLGLLVFHARFPGPAKVSDTFLSLNTTPESLCPSTFSGWVSFSPLFASEQPASWLTRTLAEEASLFSELPEGAGGHRCCPRTCVRG